MRTDGLECGFEVGGRGGGGETLDCEAGGRGEEGVADRGQGVGTAGEEGHCHVSMLRMGEDACDSRALGGL